SITMSATSAWVPVLRGSTSCSEAAASTAARRFSSRVRRAPGSRRSPRILPRQPAAAASAASISRSRNRATRSCATCAPSASTCDDASTTAIFGSRHRDHLHQSDRRRSGARSDGRRRVVADRHLDRPPRHRGGRGAQPRSLCDQIARHAAFEPDPRVRHHAARRPAARRLRRSRRRVDWVAPRVSRGAGEGGGFRARAGATAAPARARITPGGAGRTDSRAAAGSPHVGRGNGRAGTAVRAGNRYNGAGSKGSRAAAGRQGNDMSIERTGNQSAPAADDPSAEQAEEQWELRLYTAGQTPKSILAFNNLKRICEEHMPGRYQIEVVDLMRNPRLAKEDQIVAIPTLVRKLPQPLRKIIGDLSDTERTLVGLQLRSRSQ